MLRFSTRKTGFTLVELAIVITVIGILAAITVVAYNGYQARSNDAKIRAAAAQLEKAILVWSHTYGDVIRGGSGSTVVAGADGCTNGANGWFGSGSYTCTAEDTLVAGKAIPSGFTASLPRNTFQSATNGRLSMMLYACGTSRYVLMWTLQNPSTEDNTKLSSALSTCGYTLSTFQGYGMRSATILQL